MKHNVEYHTKDQSLGHVMAITEDTTLKQIINFIGDYTQPLNLTIDQFLAGLDGTTYIYLNKKTGRYFFTKSLSTLPEIEDGENKK